MTLQDLLFLAGFDQGGGAIMLQRVILKELKRRFENNFTTLKTTFMLPTCIVLYLWMIC